MPKQITTILMAAALMLGTIFATTSAMAADYSDEYKIEGTNLAIRNIASHLTDYGNAVLKNSGKIYVTSKASKYKIVPNYVVTIKNGNAYFDLAILPFSDDGGCLYFNMLASSATSGKAEKATEEKDSWIQIGTFADGDTVWGTDGKTNTVEITGHLYHKAPNDTVIMAVCKAPNGTYHFK